MHAYVYTSACIHACMYEPHVVLSHVDGRLYYFHVSVVAGSPGGLGLDGVAGSLLSLRSLSLPASSLGKFHWHYIKESGHENACLHRFNDGCSMDATMDARWTLRIYCIILLTTRR